MVPEFVWVAVVLVLAVVALAMVGLMAVASYFIYQLGREKQLEARREFNAPVPPPELDDDEELTDEEKAARTLALLDHAKDQGRMSKDEWRAEKLEEGWSPEDIEEFLANRPLLELN